MTKLMSFEVENFRSFYKAQRIDFCNDGIRPVTALFGPNAGGKSNLILALANMMYCVRDSANANWTLPYEPFLLKEDSSERPTRFAISFEHDGRVFFYEFSYSANAIVTEVMRERSAHSQKKRIVFERSISGGLNDGAVKNGFGKRLESKTRPETLLITKGREDNNEYANAVFALFSTVVLLLEGGEGSATPLFVEMLRENANLKVKTLELLKKCDFAIRDIVIENVPVPMDVIDSIPLPPELKRNLEWKGGTSLKTVHAVRDDESTVVKMQEFDFWSQESVGTRKFFEVAVPILSALENGQSLFIDEFSSYIHPALANVAVDLFRRQEDGGNLANLVMVSHNTALMSDGLSREEIFLVEKTLSEESRIVPLAETGARKNEPFEKRYIAGYYGGMPLIRE